MREINIKIDKITPKQWANFLIELNLMKDAWKRFGPEVNIKAKNFNKINKWGKRKPGGHDEDGSDSDPLE